MSLEQFVKNRNAFPTEELDRYTGQHVGLESRRDADPGQRSRPLESPRRREGAGYDPAETPIEDIPSEDVFPGGGSSSRGAGAPGSRIPYMWARPIGPSRRWAEACCGPRPMMPVQFAWLRRPRDAHRASWIPARMIRSSPIGSRRPSGWTSPESEERPIGWPAACRYVAVSAGWEIQISDGVRETYQWTASRRLRRSVGDAAEAVCWAMRASCSSSTPSSAGPTWRSS